MTLTVSGIGFYAHKELGAAEIGILSTQRMSRGRDPDFNIILSTQRTPRGSGPILSTQTFYGACFKKNLLNKMRYIVNTISALRALVLKRLLRKMSEL